MRVKRTGGRAGPTRIYRAEQVRELDRRVIEEHDIPGYTLMYRAGEAAFRTLRKRWPQARRILVLCGAGNNAGDGYVLARLAQAENVHVTVAALFDPDKLKGDAGIACDTYRSGGGAISEWHPLLIETVDVVVDAILGTGLVRPLAGHPAEVVAAVNSGGKPVLALDIPTGLSADTGKVMGRAVRAEATITFVGLKMGLYTGQGREYAGEIVFDDLGVAALLSEDHECAARLLSTTLLQHVLPRRRRAAHKGDHGHVLVIGGGAGMPGAVRLAAEAALLAGAGRVSVATLPEHLPVVLAGRPELMCHGLTAAAELQPLLDAADIVVLGPGLGQGSWGQAMFAAAMSRRRPMVVDADALNLLATNPVRNENWVLTPHPGEAGRLLGEDTRSVQEDRLTAIAQLQGRYHGVVVLKGSGTLVARGGEEPWLCAHGNPGMAAAGMGDVLTGLIAGITAQCGDPFDGARAGVLVHALAGDDAASAGERGMTASDLLRTVRNWVNPKE